MNSGTEINITEDVFCPICNNRFPQSGIEEHANKCIFLNCPDEKPKRKRSPPMFERSETHSKLTSNQKSARDNQGILNQFEVSKNRQSLSMFSKTSKTDAKICSSSTSSTVDVFEKVSDSSLAQKPLKKYDLSFKVPLAIQVRPKTLDEFFGQGNILGNGTVLHSLLDKGEIPNMILWGPPGCGKTSLSHVVHEICKKNPTKWKFINLCAATCGIKEVQNAVTLAKNDLKFGKRTVLFMDEIHRFNKKQQDVFLMCVEKGEIILIGATTENPSFSIISALLSRCRVVVLQKLTSDDLYKILEKAAEFFEVDIIDNENPAGTFVDDEAGLAIESAALKWMSDISDGDARTALNNLQLVLHYFDKSSNKTITVQDIEDKLKRAHLLYDKAGEEHYNLISAMHKSIRGSDPNAALYWTTRMILSGEDPKYIARRMVRAASEDIGMFSSQLTHIMNNTEAGICEENIGNESRVSLKGNPKKHNIQLNQPKAGRTIYLKLAKGALKEGNLSPNHQEKEDTNVPLELNDTESETVTLIPSLSISATINLENKTDTLKAIIEQKLYRNAAEQNSTTVWKLP